MKISRKFVTLAEEALADAVLMGCDEAQFRQVLHDLLETVVNPYRTAED